MLRTLLGRRKKSGKKQARKRMRAGAGTSSASNSLEEEQPASAEVTTASNDTSIVTLSGNTIWYCPYRIDSPVVSLSEGLDPEYRKEFLHMACKKLNKDSLDEILATEIDVNVQDDNGNTALHFVADNGVRYCFQIGYQAVMLTMEAFALKLMSKGADANIRNKSGETPLHIAVAKQNREVVTVILNNGADPDLKNRDGDTALHIAIKKCVTSIADSEDIVRSLLENGANVHSQDRDGRTAIHYIISTDEVMFRTIFTDLLIWGASVFTPDENGEPLVNQVIFSDTIHMYKKPQKALVEYIIALQCANFDSSEYAIVESTLPFENFISPNMAKHQLERMKRVKCGTYSLYDIFDKYSDPLFVLDEDVECSVKNARFQLDIMDYGSLLKAKFKSAQQRYKMMCEVHNKLTNELPNEVVWKILTFLQDKDLEAVSRAVSG